jgi:bifunctional UDP-N-acetylglucosamine pyrophosphorylase/glucosamine-1-phosphate N-acetyltransferase
MFVNDGLKVSSFTVADNSETLGINDRYQLSSPLRSYNNGLIKLSCSRVSRSMIRIRLTSDRTVKIGQDTVIRAGTYLMGNTTIGLENVIGPNCYIENCQIGDYNEIIYSHLTDT